MEALVLGAGYGTRLYPITKNRPKPLLPVGDEPILDKIFKRLRSITDLEHIYIVSNDRFISHFTGWKQARSFEMPVSILNDGTRTPEERLGAIGDLQFAIDECSIEEELLVVAGDNVIEFNLNEFVSFFREHGTTIGLKDLGKMNVESYSVVETDENHKVTDFKEKPALTDNSLISIGLYLFKQDHLPLIASYLEEEQNPDEPGYFIQWLHSRVPVYGFEVDGPWYDIGDIKSYNEANDFYEEKEA